MSEIILRLEDVPSDLLEYFEPMGDTEDMKSVVEISPVGFKDAHFATFPPRLAEIPILTSCPRYTCPNCGKPWIRVTKPSDEYAQLKDEEKSRRGSMRQNDTESFGLTRGKGNKSITPIRFTTGWRQSCSCHPGLVPVPGVVYDPFMGSGTTALVALEHGRRFIGAELNFDYVRMARRRIAVTQTPGLDDFFSALTTWATQFDDLPLFQLVEFAS